MAIASANTEKGKPRPRYQPQPRPRSAAQRVDANRDLAEHQARVAKLLPPDP